MDSLESELDFFKSNGTEVKLSESNKLKIIEIYIRKCLMLRVVLQQNYPSVWPVSIKLHTLDTQSLKITRQKSIEHFIKNTQLELNSIIDENQGKCVLTKFFEKIKLNIEKEEFLNESLDALGSKSKNQAFKIDDEFNSASDKGPSKLKNNNTKTASSLHTDSESEDNEHLKAKKSSMKKNLSKIQNDDSDEQKEQKFKGADFIFQRIKWDENIDKDQVVIGYLDRFLGIKSIQFNDYKGVHDDRYGVPLHRIRHFKINGKIVWDRDNKIDLITGIGDVSGFFVTKKQDELINDDNSIPKNKLMEQLTNQQVYEFKSNNWSVVEENRKETVPNYLTNFSLLTYNLMSRNNFKKSIISKMNFKKKLHEAINRDEFTKDELGLKNLDKIDRISKIIEQFEINQPDFLLLQECEDHEESILKESEFIQKNYFICSSKRNDASQEHSNCVLLTKIKPTFFKLLKLTDNSNKAALITKFEVINDSLQKPETILLVNLHLTSNKSDDFLRKRRTQLETLKQYLVDRVDEFDFSADYTFVCGDFNFGDLSENENSILDEILIQNGFKDLVKNACTFDPSENFTASITAFKTEPRRLDRILLKTSNTKLELTNTFLFNTAPFKIDKDECNPILYEPYLSIKSYETSNQLLITERGVLSDKSSRKSVIEQEFYLHPSDHYGLECHFNFKKHKHEPSLVYKSALAIIAPKFVADEFVQLVREKYDPQVKRWPPHINLLYPFYDNIDLDLSHDQDSSVIGDLHACLSKLESFDCDLTEIGVFESNNVVYLEPSKKAQDEMKKIYKTLKTVFDDEKNKKWNRPSLNPHMTIAQPVDKRGCEKNWAQKILEKIKNEFKDLMENNKPLVKFNVDCVYWITRTDTTPFKIKHAFPLGSRYPLTITGLNPISFKSENGLIKFLCDKKAIVSADHDNKLMEIYEKIEKQDSLKSEFNQNLLIPVGSYQYGIKCNDLDICLLKPQNGLTKKELMSQLVDDLSQNKDLFHIVRSINDAIVPIIELCLKNDACQSADIQIYEINYENVKFDNRLFFNNFKFMLNMSKEIGDLNKVFGITGIFENQNLKKFIHYYKDFQIVLSFVKYWAKCRNLYGKAFGYLGGISWSLMVAFFLLKKFDLFSHELSLDNSDQRFKTILREFFKFYSDWDWKQKISLIDVRHVSTVTGSYQPKSPIMILQSVFPYNNTSKNVTEKSAKLIVSELKRWLKILSESEDYNLACDKISLGDLPPKKICLKLIYRNSNDLGHLFTLFKAKIQGLITNLQKIESKIEFRAFTEFFDSECSDRQKDFFIGIYDYNNFYFNDREKGLIREHCNYFISSISSLSLAKDFEILTEYNW